MAYIPSMHVIESSIMLSSAKGRFMRRKTCVEEHIALVLWLNIRLRAKRVGCSPQSNSRTNVPHTMGLGTNRPSSIALRFAALMLPRHMLASVLKLNPFRIL